MKKLVMPSDEDGWEIMAANIIRDNLTLANMSQRDLARELEQMGFYYSHSNINSKLSRGTFSTAFFLQALVAIGVENVELPPAVKRGSER